MVFRPDRIAKRRERENLQAMRPTTLRRPGKLPRRNASQPPPMEAPAVSDSGGAEFMVFAGIASPARGARNTFGR